MNPSALFLRRPIMTCIIMFALLFFGLLSYRALPVSDLPNIDYPTIVVSTSYPGATPETMANNVAAPLEKKFTRIDGIQSIYSTSSTGSTSIVLQFALNKSISDASIEVQSAINQASGQLPQDLPFSPSFDRVNPSATPIMYLSISSKELKESDLYRWANMDLGRQINILNGVGEVHTYGSPWGIRIQVDPDKLAARGLGIDDAARAIGSHNVQMPTGTLYGDVKEYDIEVDGQITAADEYNALVLSGSNGEVVRLSDVGHAFNSLEDDKFDLRYLVQDRNEPCVVLAIQKQPGANAVEVIDEIHALFDRVRPTMPQSISLDIIYDKALIIEEAVSEVKLTVVIAIALVVLIIFLYLGTPLNTLIPALAIPMSILGTLIVMHLCGYTIDILSLLAITLSIGFLVDDAVVVLENITRHIEMGKSPKIAARDGSKQIAFTIVAMTLSLGAVFIPMLFMDGVMGKLFKEFAVTILVAILFSGFISLTLTPLMCSRLIRIGTHRTTRIHNWILHRYTRLLDWVIKRPIRTLITGAALVAATLALLVTIPKDFMPEEDLGFLQAFSQMSDSTSINTMNSAQNQLATRAKESSSTDTIVTISGMPTHNKGLMFMRLKDKKERPPLKEVIADLYSRSANIPGVQLFIKPWPLIDLSVGTGQMMANYQYSLTSLDQELLFDRAAKFEERLKSTSGISDVSSDLHMGKPQLKLSIDRDKASYYGVTARDIESTLSYAYAGSYLSPISTPDDQYYVLIELAPRFSRFASKLAQLYVRSSITGAMVPLREIAKIDEGVGPVSINHVNSLPSVTFSFNFSGIPLEKGTKILKQIENELIPAGSEVRAHFQGSGEVFAKSLKNLAFLLIITLFVIYALLAILYENTVDPLTVMSTLPPAALGGLLTLMLFREPLSLYGFVGIILLLGIVLKNGIILVDFAAETLKNEEISITEAMRMACLKRLRPILMTTMAALMGAVPIAIGIGGLSAAGRRPLGLVIVGGLIVSQVLTLFFTPVVYIALEKLRHRWRRKA